MLGILQGLLLAISVDQGLLALSVRGGLHLLGVDQGVLALVLLQLRVGFLVIVSVVQAREVEHALALAEHLTLLDSCWKTPKKSKKLVDYNTITLIEI